VVVPLPGVGLAIKAERAAHAVQTAAKVEHEAEAGVVYLRLNPKNGEIYIGQAKSTERFLARQGEHNAELGVKHDFEVLGRAKPGKSLDRLEETKMREAGGIQSKGGPLANKRHQMSEENYRKAGGTVDRPYE